MFAYLFVLRNFSRDELEASPTHSMTENQWSSWNRSQLTIHFLKLRFKTFTFNYKANFCHFPWSFQWGRDFLYIFRLALRPTQFPVWCKLSLFPRRKVARA